MAVTEYETLAKTVERFGYEVVELPKSDVKTRADFVLSALGRT